MGYINTCHVFVDGVAGDMDDGITGYGVMVTDQGGRVIHEQSGAFNDGPDSGTGGTYGARMRALQIGTLAARDLGVKKLMLHADPEVVTEIMYCKLNGNDVPRDEDGNPDYFRQGVYTVFVRDTPEKPWWDRMAVAVKAMAGSGLGVMRALVHGSRKT